jgi:uncharacterized membrane protein
MSPRAVLKPVVTLATLAYPLVIYLGFGRWEPKWLALALATLLFLRAWSGPDVVWFAAGIGALVLAAATALGSSWLPLKLYPLMVSAVLLATFGLSLWRPPTVVERIARLTEPQLDAQGVAYTRNVTIAWCVFFFVNGAIAAVTALWASTHLWLLYNGLIAYVLMGGMFAGEWLLRQRRRASARVSHG